MTSLVSEGRTLFFVSHDLSAIEVVCRRAAFLRVGEIAAVGSSGRDTACLHRLEHPGAGTVHKKSMRVEGGGLTLEGVTVHVVFR